MIPTQICRVFFFLLLVFSSGLLHAEENQADDYLAMVTQIDRLLQEAVSSYETGDVLQAKRKVQTAYFEIFENLEGPIRINISAKKNYEFEETFGEIRRLIVEKGPLPALQAKVTGLVTDLHNILDDLEGGHELTAATPLGGSEVTPTQFVKNQNWRGVSENLLARIQQAIALYESGQKTEATQIVQDTYFDVFEASGMEMALGARSEVSKRAIEERFTQLVAGFRQAKSIESIREIAAFLEADLAGVITLLSVEKRSPRSLFGYSLLIILREGIEAILIVSAIIAYLLKAGHQDKLKTIYHACISALVLSVLTAILLKWVFDVSAKSQEILEGATMLLAAGVLFFVSYWLISKAESQKWVTYIKGKIGDSLVKGSLKALWFTAFLAVYREGAETVLFYKALTVEANLESMGAIMAGFILGCGMLTIVYFLMRYGILKLPVHLFFAVTGGLLYYMSFVFVGQGVMELIEGGVVQPSPIAWLPQIPAIGLYAYWETWLPQLLIIVLGLIGLAILTLQKRRTT